MAKSTKSTKTHPTSVSYTLGKGTPRLLNLRINREEIHLHVNGPGMLYGAARILTSLDMEDGATYQAWKKLVAALSCMAYCGHHGKEKIPVEVETSRIGTCAKISTGPMSMYSNLVVLRPKKKGTTMREVLDDAFLSGKKSYTAFLVPEAAIGHHEDHASMFTENSGSDESVHHHQH